MDLVAINRLCMMALSATSAAASASVIISYVCLHEMRSRKYYRLLLYIAISTFLSNVGSSFGIVRDGSVICWIQGLLTNIFTLSLVFWTVILTGSLYVVMKKKVLMNIVWWMHAFCWLLPITLTLLPLSELTIGSAGKEWCFFQSNDDSVPVWRERLWDWLGFYMWVFGSVLVILIYMAKIRTRDSEKIFDKETFEVLLKKLRYYPLIIFICLVPNCIFDSMVATPGGYESDSEWSQSLNLVATICDCSHGLLFSLIFWYQNQEVYDWWMRRSKDPARLIAPESMSQGKAILVTQRKLFDAYYVDEEVQRGTDFSDVSLRDTDAEVSILEMNVPRSTVSVTFKNDFGKIRSPKSDATTFV